MNQINQLSNFLFVSISFFIFQVLGLDMGSRRGSRVITYEKLKEK